MASDIPGRPTDILRRDAGSRIGGISGAETAENKAADRKPEIPHAIAVANNDLGNLLEVTKTLANRLAPVLRKTEAEEGHGAGSIETCELGHQVMSLAVGMRFVTWTLQDILHRLEL